MKALIQRVTEASVNVDASAAGSIGRGLLVLLGVEKGDTEKDLDYIVRKIANLRIFEDQGHKMNLSLKDIRGEALVVSQFTLPADCRRGNRPSFDRSETPAEAERMYLRAIDLLRQEGIPVETGVFGAMMQVTLINDGPVTFMLDSR